MLDPLENGLYDIPDYDNIDDEAFPPLPPPASPGQEDNDGDPFANGDEDGEVSKLPDVPKRRGVKRPQPKLDSQRLTSERGLPALRNMFDNVTFKGKGHEADDLRVLMQRMENWAHRLYPKLQFEDFIDKLETLGAKKEVQTCLKRIRLDMPLTHEDFIGHEDEPQNHVPDEPQDRVPDDPFGEGNFPEDPFIHSTPAPAPTSVSLSEEQQRRIELNKQLALERRLARMQQQQQGASQADGSGAAEEPSPSTSTSASTSASTSTPVSQEDVQEQDQEPEEQGKETGSSEHSAAADTSEDKAPPPDSPLFDDEGDSPAPALTNGVVDSSD
ncbi:TIMELESS-interacting protein isoform X2 [Sardina pilchardus]|uniref:TIMELESS-interacting protein isoform X2 n=1 Tax=Sardina pilchardus TaxID=27697 RepID=UPI002E0EF157